ncbi:MAG: LysM peptidoglycan-binding domain-containing protein [Bacteroidia bacterium]
MKISSVKNLLSLLFTVALLFLAMPALAQPDGIKKSKKTEVIDGKKYYLHTVEKGQTLYAIAKAYDLTVNDVVMENPDALNGIRNGQVLRIPAQKPVTKNNTAVQPKDTSSFIIHKVEPGQTLYSLTKKYNVTEEQLNILNPELKNGLKVGMELKIPVKKSAVPVNTLPVPAVNKDTVVAGEKKDVYNVALMLPLQLWNTDNIEPDKMEKDPNIQWPAKSEAAVQFYEGALLAVDSMKKAGMKVKLHVYDIDDADSGKVDKVLSKPEFVSMDLIIGPLSPGPFQQVAQFAKERHIAVISPVSPANKVLFKQPQALKIMPSSSTQMEVMAEYIAEKHKSDNVILLTNSSAKDQAAAMSFKNHYNKIQKDSVRTNKGVAGLESLLKKDKLNVIVVPSLSQAYVTDLLRSLKSLSENYSIMVFGMSAWMSYENIDPEYLEALQVHFVATTFVDFTSPQVKHFVTIYHHYFKGDPGTYVYTGYDVTLFALQQIQKNGTGFYQQSETLSGKGLQQDFQFSRTDKDSGCENRGVRIVRIMDYSFVRQK